MTYNFGLWLQFRSLLIAFAVTAFTVGLWFAFTKVPGLSFAIGCAIVCFILMYVAFDLVLKQGLTIDLSGFAFQASPIATASLIAGWSAHGIFGDFHQENAILMAATCIFAFQSMIALTESAFPDNKKVDKATKADAEVAYKQSDKIRLCLSLIIFQGVLMGVIGYWAAASHRSIYPAPEELPFCYKEARICAPDGG